MKSSFKARLKTFFSTFVVPVLVLVGYILLAMILMQPFPDNTATVNYITDGIVCLVLGFFAVREQRFICRRDDYQKLRFSAFGWLVIAVTFAALYVASEMAGLTLRETMPLGLTSAYTEMSDFDVYLYIAMAVSVAPLCEELLFRWMMFHRFRSKVSFWPAYIISTFFFTLVHGTIMHIPVTVALSLFLCLFYEMTGNFFYCVLFHVLFNWCGATFIFSVPTTNQFIIWGVYGCMLALLVAGYIFRDKLFHKYLKQGSLEQFESYLDEKRKHFSDNDNASVKQDAGQDSGRDV